MKTTFDEGKSDYEFNPQKPVIIEFPSPLLAGNYVGPDGQVIKVTHDPK